MNIRPANPKESRHLAELINLAGEGLPVHVWRQMAENDEAPLDIGTARAAREQGTFSYRNAWVAEIDGNCAGMVLGYQLPDPYEMEDMESLSPVVRVLVELEAKASGSWYINALATYAQFRGKGVGSALMTTTEDLAYKAGAKGLSLIVASDNAPARSLYKGLGYQQIAAAPLMSYPGGPKGDEWLLLLKTL